MRINKILLIISTYSLLLVSCTEGNRTKKLLTGVKYWDNYSSREANITGCYQFNKDGSCYFFVYGLEGKYGVDQHRVRQKFNTDDVIYPHTWQLKGDSMLNIEGFDRRILSVKMDTIILQNIKLLDTIVLINYTINNFTKEPK